MPKCFFTGIDLRLEDASVLDRGGARRALRALKERVAALERLIRELGQFDTVEVFDAKTRGNKTCSQHRMIAPTIAAALGSGGWVSAVPLARRKIAPYHKGRRLVRAANRAEGCTACADRR